MDYEKVNQFIDYTFLHTQNVYAVEEDNESEFYPLNEETPYDYTFNPSDYYTDQTSEDRRDNSSIHIDPDGVDIETSRSELVSQSSVIPESKNILHTPYVSK